MQWLREVCNKNLPTHYITSNKLRLKTRKDITFSSPKLSDCWLSWFVAIGYRLFWLLIHHWSPCCIRFCVNYLLWLWLLVILKYSTWLMLLLNSSRLLSVRRCQLMSRRWRLSFLFFSQACLWLNVIFISTSRAHFILQNCWDWMLNS